MKRSFIYIIFEYFIYDDFELNVVHINLSFIHFFLLIARANLLS